ncbi:MAG TPA: hypothetical protein ENK85_11880 [Saprospiraceae bacterium]|nr:hypothetical protein [Saprospiraceae bacterium]
MLKFPLKSGLLFLFVALLWQGCGDKDPKPADVQIDFKTYVKSDEAVQNELIYHTAVGHYYSLLNLRYYLTHISLVKDDGTVVELKKAHLRDIHVPATKTIEAADVAAGHYTAMTFTFGIKKAENIVTFLDNTLANQNMYWPEQLGPGKFHYMKLEGQYYCGNDTCTVNNYAFHLGPTFGADYSFDVSQPIDLTIDGEKKFLEIRMDIDQWFHDPNDYDFDGWGPGIMNKPAAQEIARANGHNVFSAVVD